VGKVDGLAKASILDIDGVAVPAASAVVAAYSVRLLGSALGVPSYTGDCLRVRRASDNVEADIAFDAGELKLTSGVSNTSDAQSYTDFADFVDHTGTPTDAFVRYWYDQSGNANDAGQSTAGSQPQIYDAATGLITENGKPAVETANDSYLEIASETFGIVDAFTVATQNTNSNFNDLLESGNHQSLRTFSNQYRLVSTNADDWAHTATYVYFNGSVPTSNPSATSQALVYVGGGSRGFLQISTDFTGGTATARFWDGNIQEIVLYDADQSGNRTGIESNINGFYSIYP